jgi:hypothetical protein
MTIAVKYLPKPLWHQEVNVTASHRARRIRGHMDRSVPEYLATIDALFSDFPKVARYNPLENRLQVYSFIDPCKLYLAHFRAELISIRNGNNNPANVALDELLY